LREASRFERSRRIVTEPDLKEAVVALHDRFVE
jgi:hypothetical protein